MVDRGKYSAQYPLNQIISKPSAKRQMPLNFFIGIRDTLGLGRAYFSIWNIIYSARLFTPEGQYKII